MKRIAIVGCGGAGKSTLARELGEILGIEVHHLDAIHWQPGWVSIEEEAFAALQWERTRGERWIFDGNYDATLEIRLQAADTVIFLDFPRGLCLFRVICRWLRYNGQTRPDMGAGCPEKVDFQFLHWIWTFPRHSRPRLLALLAAPPAGIRLYHLRSPRQVACFLRKVRESCTAERLTAAVEAAGERGEQEAIPDE